MPADAPRPTAPKRLALIGSSGGNLRSHGGDDPAALAEELRRQVDAAGMELAGGHFVAATDSMDGIADDAPAALWAWEGDRLVRVLEGPLADVNAAARERDAQLAVLVRAGGIDGLVLASADPGGVNRDALEAAAATGIPCAGTGGTSIAAAQARGARLVAVSGTTGTSNRTRAVSAVSGLAREFGLPYRPALGTTATGDDTAGGPADGPAWRRISLRGIMVGSLPAFIVLALVLAISRIPALAGLADVFEALIAGLPIVVAAVAARRVSGLGELGVVAGVVAGILSVDGGILGGLAAGILAGLLAPWLLAVTLRRRFPATTANIVTGAIAGLLPGLLVFYLLAPVTAWLGDGVQGAIEWALATNPLLAGALAGLVMWPAIIGGVYHGVILPLVLLEMSEKGMSFLGAVDMVSLVMVSFGIMCANLLVPRTSGERALAGTGGAVNFFFGTFVEASYPFLFGDRRVFAAALVAATAGGAVAGAFRAEATAYLPAIVAPFVSNDVPGMVLAMVTGAGLAFALTLVINLSARRRGAESGEPAAAADRPAAVPVAD